MHFYFCNFVIFFSVKIFEDERKQIIESLRNLTLHLLYIIKKEGDIVKAAPGDTIASYATG